MDRFLELHPEVKHPDFLKIDTEGWELHVLKGAYHLLKNEQPVIMMEYAQRNLNLTNTKQSDLYDYLYIIGLSLSISTTINTTVLIRSAGVMFLNILT